MNNLKKHRITINISEYEYQRLCVIRDEKKKTLSQISGDFTRDGIARHFLTSSPEYLDGN